MPRFTAYVLVSALAGASLIGLAAAARAQTPEEQQACQFDAQTYCQEAIPDHGRVYRCLQRNRAKISPACRAAISHGRAPRRGRPG